MALDLSEGDNAGLAPPGRHIGLTEHGVAQHCVAEDGHAAPPCGDGQVGDEVGQVAADMGRLG